jgi:translation initiation factor 4E
MGLNAQLKDPSGGPGATARPRLAANALRTGSTTSLATTASTTDSMAVNVPNTRSASPSAISTSPPHSNAHTPTESNGDALTSERLEKHNQETSPVSEKKQVKVGFKNIPSLDAITARMVKTRQLSVDGSAKPPEAPMIEDPKTPGAQMKAPEHPLQFPWCVFLLGATGGKC